MAHLILKLFSRDDLCLDGVAEGRFGLPVEQNSLAIIRGGFFLFFFSFLFIFFSLLLCLCIVYNYVCREDFKTEEERKKG